MANERADAANTVAALAFFGLLAGVIGSCWALVAWPDGSIDDSRLMAVLGVAIAIAGGFALMAAVVAWAVRLGIRWSGLRDEVVHEVLHAAKPSDRGYLDEDGR